MPDGIRHQEKERNCFQGHLLFHFLLNENEIERDLMTDGYDRPDGHKIASVGLFLFIFNRKWNENDQFFDLKRQLIESDGPQARFNRLLSQEFMIVFLFLLQKKKKKEKFNGGLSQEINS